MITSRRREDIPTTACLDMISGCTYDVIYQLPEPIAYSVNDAYR